MSGADFPFGSPFFGPVRLRFPSCPPSRLPQARVEPSALWIISLACCFIPPFPVRSSGSPHPSAK